MKKIITGAVLAFMPLFVFAQTSIFTWLGTLKNILDILIPILVTAALVYFIYGVVRYVISSDSDDKEKARSVITRGVLGLFIIVSIWGLVGIIQTTTSTGGGGEVGGALLPTVGGN